MSRTIRVPHYSDEDLTRLAVRHYNDALSQTGRMLPELVARMDSEKEFLDRLRVNYLRHQVSDHVCPLGAMLPGYTYQQLQVGLYEAIAAAYPKLWRECKRQLSRKVEE